MLYMEGICAMYITNIGVIYILVRGLVTSFEQLTYH